MLSRFMAVLLTDGFSVTIIPNKESERQEKMPSQMRNSLWKTAAFQAEYSPKTASLVELYQLFRAPGTDRPGLLNIQPLHEPGELLPGQRLYFPGIPRPLVTAIVQPLVQQYKAVWFPQQRLQPVTAFAAEQKQAAGIGIYPKVLLHKRDQAVQSLAHIGVATDNIHVLGLSDISQHLKPALSPA